MVIFRGGIVKGYEPHVGDRSYSGGQKTSRMENRFKMKVPFL